MKAKVVKSIRALAGRLLTPPPRYAGTKVLNRLGLQFLRIAWCNAIYHLYKWPRGTSVLEPYASAFRRDGAVIVPDFLPEEAYRELKSAYDAAKQSARFVSLDPAGEQYKGKPGKVGKARVEMRDHPELAKIVDRYFLQSARLKALGSIAARRTIKRFKTPVVFIHKIVNPDGIDFGPVSSFHYDAIYPSVKMFYYLSDIDTGNGAFTYAKGSHKMTLPRLAYEYKKSNVWASYQAINPELETDEEGYGFDNPTADEMRDLSITPSPMVAPANPFVLFRSVGLRKRDSFCDSRPREMLEISYRA